MNKEYQTYLALLQEDSDIKSEEIQAYLSKFKPDESKGITSNMMYYILNLSSQKYEYVNSFAENLTGYKPEVFLSLGTKLLPKLITEKDYNLLVNDVFPEIQKEYKNLDFKYKENALFELHYSFNNKQTKDEVKIVEYSSYAKFDNQQTPQLSTGVIMRSSQNFKGVRGILRIKKNNILVDVCDLKSSSEKKMLSSRELQIIKLICQGFTKQDVADQLFLAKGTVHSHIKNIYKKLNINKQTELFQFKEHYL